MKNKILNILSILFGLMFINGGLNKIFHYIPQSENTPQGLIDLMGTMSEIVWLIPLLVAGELVGGILVLFKRTRALGAVVIFPILMGIVLAHIFNDPSGLIIALILLVIELWIIFENKSKYMSMIGR